MNKKASTTSLIKFLIGLVIAIAMIVVLLNVMDKFILFGKEKPNQQKDFFNKLNKNIEENKETTQIFQLQDNYLLISFNNKNSIINTKQKLMNFEGTTYDANKETTIKKPPQCTNCLCLCMTKDDKYLFEDDCLQPDDICTEHDKEIASNNQPFFLFGEETYNLNLKIINNKINIEI